MPCTRWDWTYHPEPLVKIAGEKQGTAVSFSGVRVSGGWIFAGKDGEEENGGCAIHVFSGSGGEKIGELESPRRWREIKEVCILICTSFLDLSYKIISSCTGPKHAWFAPSDTWTSAPRGKCGASILTRAAESQ